MKRYFLIIMCSLFFSCQETRKNDFQIQNNSILIENEFSDIDHQFLLNYKVQKYYFLAKGIKTDYDTILKNYLEGKPFNEIQVNKLMENIALINASQSSNYKISELNAFERNPFQMLQLQYLTLNSIKSIKESIFSNDYPTNIIRVETIKKNDKIKFVLVQMDTTLRPCIMIGKLKENKKEFIDTFIMAQYEGIYPEIPIKDISDKKFIEGLFIIPTIGGNLDTIIFKKEINSW